MATGDGLSWGDPRGSRRSLPLLNAIAPALDPTVTMSWPGSPLYFNNGRDILPPHLIHRTYE